MTTRFDDDEDPEFDPTTADHDPDDPLLILLGPASAAPSYLGAPPGRYEEIRRTATRRRRTRVAAGVGVACTIAALIVLPLNLTTAQSPRAPTLPQAPPPASIPVTPPVDRSPTSSPATPQPSEPATSDPAVPDEVPSGASAAPSQTPAEGADPARDHAPVPTPAPSTDATTGAFEPTPSEADPVATPDSSVAP
ncbi:hypothetical protein [Streptomyces sp. B21-083]|uniref:hypothetical protein n=1 Tax=Streptomyces sp. B21-083 TaxID=3039410 RepID=UPI002FF1D794